MLRYSEGELASRLFDGLLLMLTVPALISAQSVSLRSIRSLVNNGSFEEAGTKVPPAIERARKAGAFAQASEIGVLLTQSLTRLERYEEAGKVADAAQSDAERSKNPRSMAAAYFAKAALARTVRDFSQATENARKGLAAAPNDPQLKLEHHLAIGRVLYSSGYDVAAIVWLEKAEKLSTTLPVSWSSLDVLGHLSFAWASKFNYAKAIEYEEKLIKIAELTEYKYRYRLALFDLANLWSSVGQERKATALLKKGRELSITVKDDYESCLFLNTLLLNSLYQRDVQDAERHLTMLESLDRNNRFKFGSVLGSAVIAARKGQRDLAEKYFAELSSLKGHSDYIVPYWRLTIAEQMKDWDGMVKQGEALQKLAEAGNFRDDLPGIHVGIAKGYRGLGKMEAALEHAKQAATIIESDRPSGDASLSLSVLETYHSVYRLLAEAEAPNNIQLALELADYIKGRVLKDRIENSVLRGRADVAADIRKKAEELSTTFIEGNPDAENQLAKLEKSVTLANPNGSKSSSERRPIAPFNLPEQTAIISYFFTLSGELLAFVIEKNQPVRSVKLSVSEKEADALARSVRTKIGDRVFFKSDGKVIYDRLMAPLAVNADHIIIVPDKSLWKIPFQALSRDGESYLIEQTAISYAPSVSLLADMLRNPPPTRKTAKVFANDTYDGRYLSYVNREAATVAGIFSTRPFINATPQQFRDSAGGEDILHFSMHAQADSEEPLNSFLAFKTDGPKSGRLTVEDLLNVRLKKQNLAFLASCETNNVLNGEGLVSISWALMGSGSSSVISAQWEANDRSTETFTVEFYKKYCEGMSAARALQAASVAMIRNKSGQSHEPYYWAAFSLLGDYR